MDKKKLTSLIIILSLILIVLIVIILFPFGKSKEQPRIPEDVNVFVYPMENPATCYLADEAVIEFVTKELSEFPGLDVAGILFRTEDFEILHGVTYYNDRMIGILLDMKEKEMIWNVSDTPVSSDMPEELEGGGD